jgi:hypothetical protein
MDYQDINQIDTASQEGKLLMAALAMITTESRRDETPYQVLAHAQKLANKMYPVSIPAAITALSAELRKDQSEGSYYYTWQANIAMTLLDTFERASLITQGTALYTEYHKACNEGAKEFLNLLMKD